MPRWANFIGATTITRRKFVFSSKKTSEARNMTATIPSNTSTNPANGNGSLDVIELCKASAARAAVDDNLELKPESRQIIGIGSGSTMRYVLERLKEKCSENKIQVRCIPTSFQSKQLIYDYGLPIGELQEFPVIDFTIDGADEVDENFVAVKGGGACLAQEKVIAHAARRFVVVADYRKNSRFLCQNWTKGIPIEVLPMATNAVCLQIAQKFNSKQTALTVRIGKEKAGPVITDNGNFVIDWKYDRARQGDKTSAEWRAVSDEIKLIPGVVETGIFANMIHTTYFGQEDGSVLKKSPQS